MAKDVSNNTIMVLTVAAIIISVLAITLSFIAVSKVSAPQAEQPQTEQLPPSGTVSVDVPVEPSESGAQARIYVEDSNNS